MKNLKSILPIIIIAVLVIIVFTLIFPKEQKNSSNNIIKRVKVAGNSMEPTLKNNDIVVLKKYDVIKRCDIILFNSKETNSNLIKRIIALPGEVVEIKEGEILINDKPIKNENGYGKIQDMEKISLLEDEYFVLGDNYSISLDSRYLGPIKKENIKGIIENN